MDKFDEFTCRGDEDLLQVYSYLGAFDQGVDALRRNGLELITGRELAEVQTHNSPNTTLNETWIAENINYFPNGDTIVASREYSPC